MKCLTVRIMNISKALVHNYREMTGTTTGMTGRNMSYLSQARRYQEPQLAKGAKDESVALSKCHLHSCTTHNCAISISKGTALCINYNDFVMNKGCQF